jgi:hypothetical protein
MPNLIRLKQLDVAELSGYINQSFLGISNIGVISSNFTYHTGNFNITGNYLNLVNYASGVTGFLPTVSNGLRFNIKNIGSGITTITGSAYIDSVDSISLEKNESIELLGVNNSYYSGWATITSNPGI